MTHALLKLEDCLATWKKPQRDPVHFMTVCKGLVFSALAEQHQKRISSLHLAPSSCQVLGQSLKNRGGMITLGQSPKSHLPIMLTQEARSWLSWTPAVVYVQLGHPALKGWACPVLLCIPPPQLLFTAHFLPPKLSSLCPKFKFWETRISQKLPLYPLPIEKGTSPVERNPDNKRPLEVGGIYTYCPFCCESSVTQWFYRAK